MSVRLRPIQLLSAALQNQIAAGEVCERPASAMKELVENSLDAGASQIDVRLDNGGRDVILVQDNGCGIPKDELPLAVTRHATSKISQARDLESIATLGFRGEALPSIASVSRFSISSACGGESYRLDVTFGETGECVPASLPCGTLVSVRELFGNVPARLKFLKSPSTELKRAEETLFRIALANCSVGFSLKSGGRTLFSFVPGESVQTRLCAMWQSDVVDALLPFDLAEEGIRAHGLAAPPTMTQVRANHIYLYVNGRAVQDKRLLAAVKEAYKGKQISRDYPQCLLFLEIDPHSVDVNVHPAKSEVRFQNESDVFLFCRRAVLRAIGGDDEAESSGTAETVGSDRPDEPGQSVQPGRFAHESRPMGFWGALDKMPIFSSREETREDPFYAPWEEAGTDAGTGDRSGGMGSGGAGVRENPAGSVSPETGRRPASALHTGVHILDHVPGRLRYIGQLAATYLLFENAEHALVLFDQHAVHERVLYERIKAKTYAGRAQALMVPFELPLAEHSLERFLEVRPTIEAMGYGLALDGGVLRVAAVPPMLGMADAKSFLHDVLASRVDDCDAIVRLMACRGAIKAGQELTFEEVEHLLSEWYGTPNRGFCPHGRPTMILWDQSVLEKAFKRK